MDKSVQTDEIVDVINRMNEELSEVQKENNDLREKVNKYDIIIRQIYHQSPQCSEILPVAIQEEWLSGISGGSCGIG